MPIKNRLVHARMIMTGTGQRAVNSTKDAEEFIKTGTGMKGISRRYENVKPAFCGDGKAARINALRFFISRKSRKHDRALRWDVT